MTHVTEVQKKTSILGIDIGGTGIKAGIVDSGTGKLLTQSQKLSTPKPATVTAVLFSIKKMIEIYEWKGLIGCGFPGIIKKGVIYSAANLDKKWIGVDIEEEVKRLTGGKVTAINDADAAAITEMRFGAGKERNKVDGGVVLILTLGTGIGSAIFVNGQLFANTEFGHIEMNWIEAEKLAATVIRERQNLNCEQWGGRVNKYLQLMEKLISPDCIIIGGGVSESSEKFFPYLKVRAQLLPAVMGNDAGIIGAALAVNDS